MTCTSDDDHPRYAHTYSWIFATIVGSSNDWKIVTFENSSKSEDVFHEILKLILYGISSHMCFVVTHGYFGVAITNYTK